MRGIGLDSLRAQVGLGLVFAALTGGLGCSTEGAKPGVDEPSDGTESGSVADAQPPQPTEGVTTFGDTSQISNSTTTSLDGGVATNSRESEESATIGVAPASTSSSHADPTAEPTEGHTSDVTTTPPSLCAFEALSLSRRDVEMAGTDDTCLTLENNKLDVATCSEPVTVQLVIDPETCAYQVVSKEDHIYTDPGGDRYPQGTTCLTTADGLAGAACDADLAEQWFTLSGAEGVGAQSATAVVKLTSADATQCVWIEPAGATLGACADPKANLTLTLHQVVLETPTLSDVPIDVGHGNNWDTAGTELPLTQLVAAQGYAYFAEDKYLEQVSADAFVELELESSVTGPFMVHTNYATPFDGAKLAIYRSALLVEEFEFINSHAWRTVRAGPSFRVELEAGEKTRIRLASLNGLPHRLHRLYLTPPLPETDKLGTTTTIGSNGADIAADAVHDIYRIGAVIENDQWWWRAAWTHARLEYSVLVEDAGTYTLNVAYRAQSSDTEARWGKRIVLDDNYDAFQTIEVEGDSEGLLSAELELSAGPHRILLEHAGHDVGEPMLGNVWTSNLELVRVP